MEPVVFGLHTAQAQKWITRAEAIAVKGFFNVGPDEPLLEQSQFYLDGVTKVWIEEVSGQKPRFYILESEKFIYEGACKKSSQISGEDVSYSYHTERIRR